MRVKSILPKNTMLKLRPWFELKSVDLESHVKTSKYDCMLSLSTCGKNYCFPALHSTDHQQQSVPASGGDLGQHTIHSQP